MSRQEDEQEERGAGKDVEIDKKMREHEAEKAGKRVGSR
jgi:hypothetical protein